MWDGAGWTSLGVGLNEATFALHLHQGSLFAAGRFIIAGAVSANHIASWDGAVWTALGSGLDNDALALTTFDAGAGPDLIAGGLFTAAGGATARGIARWSGGQWSAMGTGLQGGARAATALAVHDDGSGSALYVGGSFLGAGGTPSPNIVRWDGSSWSALGSGLNGVVNALAVYNGELIAAGDFTASGATSMSRLARWDGVAWSAFTTGANGTITALQVVNAPSGQLLLAGGLFSMIGSTSASNIAFFDGLAWSALGAGASSQVRAIEPVTDGWRVGALATTPAGFPAQSFKEWLPCLATPGDLNGDGFVNSADLATLLSQWGLAGVSGDLNGDGVVNSSDLATLLSNWG